MKAEMAAALASIAEAEVAGTVARAGRGEECKGDCLLMLYDPAADVPLSFGDPWFAGALAEALGVKDPEVPVAACGGPSGPCRLCRNGFWVEKIEAYGWKEYRKLNDVSLKEHVLISSRWVEGCGIHTRLYIREDGAVVFSHDTVGYEGVHVAIPKPEYRRKILELFREAWEAWRNPY